MTYSFLRTCFQVLAVALLPMSAQAAQTIKLTELERYADGLNIEGALIPKYKLREDQIWANVAFVLDRPMLEDFDWEQLTASTPYKLKESSLATYNEAQVAYIQALILKYFTENVHTLRGLGTTETAEIIVHVHRGKSAPAHFEVLDTVIRKCLGFEAVSVSYDDAGLPTWELPHQQCRLIGHKGYDYMQFQGYETADCVISISLIAGFNRKQEGGFAVIPGTFVPYDCHNHILVESLSFEGGNHLANPAVFQKLLQMQDTDLMERINASIRSPNPAKVHFKARRLSDQDIAIGTLLQASGMFIPKYLPEHLEVI